jgi:DNA-directed RNA polymerase subunit RPC12/RpoP
MPGPFTKGPLLCEVCEDKRATCVIMHTFTCTNCGFRLLLKHTPMGQVIPLDKLKDDEALKRELES